MRMLPALSRVTHLGSLSAILNEDNSLPFALYMIHFDCCWDLVGMTYISSAGFAEGLIRGSLIMITC